MDRYRVEYLTDTEVGVVDTLFSAVLARHHYTTVALLRELVGYANRAVREESDSLAPQTFAGVDVR